jgi:hypothetical protein
MKFFYKGKEYYINQTLANQLISLVYNLKKDWDFVILVTGDRMVRVGKSVLGMTICAFLASCIKTFRKTEYEPYGVENIFFDNKLVVEESQKRPPFSIIHYDEGREGLAANKAMKSFQQDLVDFFTECGQLNHIFVIVCPDFFELKEEMAVARSEVLINVYREGKTSMRVVHGIEKIAPSLEGVEIPLVRFSRGNFNFYDRFSKALLYDISKSKRQKRYNLVKPIFKGSFTNQYPEDEETYKKLKKDSLSRFKQRHEEQAKSKTQQENERVIENIIYNMRLEGKSASQTSKELQKIGVDLSDDRIRRIALKRERYEAKKLEELETEGEETRNSAGTPRETRNSTGKGDNFLTITTEEGGNAASS